MWERIKERLRDWYIFIIAAAVFVIGALILAAAGREAQPIIGESQPAAPSQAAAPAKPLPAPAPALAALAAGSGLLPRPPHHLLPLFRLLRRHQQVRSREKVRPARRSS